MVRVLHQISSDDLKPHCLEAKLCVFSLGFVIIDGKVGLHVDLDGYMGLQDQQYGVG